MRSRRLVEPSGVVLLWAALSAQLAAAAFAEAPIFLTNAAQVRALSATDAATQIPVRLRGVVTALNPRVSVFLQDDTGGTFLTQISPNLHALQPSDEIEVEGVSYPGLFLPGVVLAKARTLGRAELPPPVPATYDDLVAARFHYERVEVTGIVRSIRWHEARACPILTLAMGPRKVDVDVVVPGVTNLPPLVDAEIRVAALAAGYINPRRQLRSPELLVSRMEDLHVQSPPPAAPFEGPLVTTRALLNFQPGGLSGHRVRVCGVVTHQQPGEALFLRDDADGLLINTTQETQVVPGDIVEAVGFPAMGRFSAFLEDAEFRVAGREGEPQPVPSSVGQIMRGTNDANLVSLEGRLLEVIRSAAESIFVVGEEETVFRARLAGRPLSLRRGSLVRLTGVCRVAETDFAGSRFRANPLELELLLRSPADITVLAMPSGWTPQRLALVLGAVLAIAIGAGAWGFFLRRRVARQTSVILDKVQREAVLEERHRMAREMHDTLAQSFSGLGFQLDALDTRLSPDQTEAHSKLEVAREMVRQGREGLRRSLLNLRAQELERADLSEALPELARQITVGTGIELRCQIRRPAQALPEVVAANLLRIGQECLVNAVEHARPNRIELVLRQEAGRLSLRVADDGSGFDPDQLQANGHFGWRGIRERAARIGADVKLETRPGHGTAVTVTMPLSS